MFEVMLNDRWLSDFWRPFQDLEANAWKSFAPATEVEETESHYLVSVDMPGVSRDSIRLEVVNNELSLSGERQGRGKFQRAFRLPETVQQDRVEADFRDGVLRIVLPKQEQAKPRQIQIGGPEKQTTGGFFQRLLSGEKQDKKETSAA